MDGLLEKFAPGGYRGVQLTAYSWELADRILSVGDGLVRSGNSADVVNNGKDDTDSSELHPARVMPSTGGFKGKRMT